MADVLEFDPSDGTVLNKIIKVNLLKIQIPGFITKIKGGTSNTDSAFYPCAATIKNITFDENSNVSSFGDYLFSSTALEYIDMSHCVKLKSLSNGLFFRCSLLKNVTLPPNLITINQGSFSSCSSLEYIDIPDSVEVIQGWSSSLGSVFSGCSKLKTIKITENSSLTTISDHAFLGTAIKTILIPKNVSAIGVGIFLSSSIETIVVSKENKKFRTDGVILFSGNQIVTAAVNSKIDYVIPENATFGGQALRGSHFNSVSFAADKNYALPGFCFSETVFKTIELPDSITSIPDHCFSYSKLESIVIPKSVTSISTSAFTNCKYLVNITLPLNLKTIANYAFSSSVSLLYIEIPYNVANFGQGVFSSCNKNLVVNFTNKERFQIINDLVINNGSTIVEYFGDDEDYELEIPSFCSIIGNVLFKGAALKSITFEERDKPITFGEYAFAGSTLQSIVFPKTLSSIGVNCFQGCTKLSHVEFCGTATVIPNYCFSGCSALKTLYFNVDCIKTIGTNAFYGTTGLKEIDLESLSVENINGYAFSCSGIESIKMPITIKSLSKYAFKGSSLVSYIDYSCLDYLTDFLFSGSSSLVNVVLGKSIKTIGQYSFENCVSLRNITLSTLTKKIEMYAFRGCKSLEFITIPEHSSLERIMPFAFDGCSKFNSFEVLDNLSFYFHNLVLMNAEKTSIIYYIPSSKERLFVVPGTVQTISAYAFQSCKNIREVIIPDGILKSIGVNAFSDCTSLKRIILPPSITSIGIDAFTGCSKLKCGSVVIEQELVEEAVKSGIRADILTPYCISSASRNSVCSCKRNARCISSSNYIVNIFMVSILN